MPHSELDNCKNGLTYKLNEAQIIDYSIEKVDVLQYQKYLTYHFYRVLKLDTIIDILR